MKDTSGPALNIVMKLSAIITWSSEPQLSHGQRQMAALHGSRSSTSKSGLQNYMILFEWSPRMGALFWHTLTCAKQLCHRGATVKSFDQLSTTGGSGISVSKT